tara:strand:- start:519 stop:1109 length:591 start_codon:yes stop_codon:yes gene_type:complete
MKLKKVGAAMGILGTGLACVRLLVLFAESFSIVNSERRADYELLTLCATSEGASSSSKFRHACTRARSDAASPIVLKAFLKAVHTVFADFTEAFSSPTKIILLSLFVLSGLSAPVVKFVAKTFLSGLKYRKNAASEDSDSDSDDDAKHSIVVLSPSSTSRGQSIGAKMRNRLMTRQTNYPSVPTVVELEESGFTFT